MVMVGASPAELDALAKQVGQAADELSQQVTIPLRQLISHSPWDGSDATRFRQDWASTLEPQLRQVAAALQTAEEDLHRNAQEQRDASSAGGSSGATTLGISPAESGDGSTSHGFTIPDLASKLAAVGTDSIELRKSNWFDGISEAGDGVSWEDYVNRARSLEKSGDVMGKVAVGADGVAYVGAAMELASGRGDLSDVFDLAGDAASLIDKTTKLAGASGVLKYTGPLGQGLGIASDVVKLVDATRDGDWLGAAYHGAHAVARGAAIVNPGLAVAVAVWDVGEVVFPVIATSPAVQQFTSDVLSRPGETIANVMSGAASSLVNGLFGKGKK